MAHPSSSLLCTSTCVLVSPISGATGSRCVEQIRNADFRLLLAPDTNRVWARDKHRAFAVSMHHFDRSRCHSIVPAVQGYWNRGYGQPLGQVATAGVAVRACCLHGWQTRCKIEWKVGQCNAAVNVPACCGHPRLSPVCPQAPLAGSCIAWRLHGCFSCAESCSATYLPDSVLIS